MNRKKITLLLTGLVVASGMMTGCSSSSDKADNGSKVAQQEGLKRATERTVTEYKGNEYPDVAYADDVTDTNIGNEMNNGVNSVDEDLNRSANYYDVTGSNEIINNDDLNGFENNASVQTPLNGFGGSTENIDDINFNNFSNNGSPNNTTSMIDSESQDLTNNVSGITNGQDMVITSGVGGSVEGLGQIPQTELNKNKPSNTIGQATIDTQDNKTETTAQNNQQSTQQAMKAKSIQTQKVGTITPIRSIGKVELSGKLDLSSSPSPQDKTARKVQGAIQFSFKLNGDILSQASTTVSNKSINELIQAAYEETLQDANAGFPQDLGTIPVTARSNLAKGLGDIFKSSSGVVNLLFQDPKGQTVSIPYNSSSTILSPDESTNLDYVRHIVDLESMKNGGKNRTIRTASQDIPISLLIRADKPDGAGNDELKTNTTYTFLGISGADVNDGRLPVTINGGTGYLDGFNIPQCTTGKIPASVRANGASNPQNNEIFAAHTNGNYESNAPVQGTVYVNDISGKEAAKNPNNYRNNYFISIEGYGLNKPNNQKQLKINGTSIDFLNIKFTDPDDTIVKIEIEDNYGKKYSCTLVDDETSTDTGYLRVTGLDEKSPYIFTKIYITSNTGNGDEIDTLELGEKSTSGATAGKVQFNTTALTTTQFTPPTIGLGSGNNQANGDVTLPGGLITKAVKNDATALRYILKVDNTDGNLGDLNVSGLNAGEESKIQKIKDSKAGITYYVLTLTNLSKGTNYGFVTLELSYTDYEGKEGSIIKSLSQINTETTDKTADNTTETDPVTGQGNFAVDVQTNYKAEYPRMANIPIFLDDMNGRYKKMSYTTSDPNSTAVAEFDGSTLKVTGLRPNTNETINLSFVYSDENGTEKSLTKYVTITTPMISDLDIKSDTAVYKDNEVKITLDYHSTPKSNIKSVSVKGSSENEIPSSWDVSTNTITLTGVEPNKNYNDLVATFTLENTNTVTYPLTPFTTGEAVVKPTGKVAEFVQRVYKIALGREPEVEGWNFWMNKLTSKEISATEFIADNLMTQPEFIERELSKQEFVKTMYTLIVNRQPDETGQKYWEDKYNGYRGQTPSIADLRIRIAREMMDQPEFKKLVTDLGLKY